MNKNVAFITGSTTGIGYGIAKAFAQKKYAIILHGIEPENTALISAFQKEHDVPVCYIQADLRDKTTTLQKLQQATDKLGDVTVLVNNAGIQHVNRITDFSDEMWQAVLDVNLTSAFYLAKAVWPSMKKSGSGRIVNIASVHGLRASEFKSAYVSAKHGMLGLTKVLALEGAECGITVNAICPGYVKTPLVEKQIADQARTHGISEAEVVEKVMLKKQAIKKFISVEAIADLAIYLASPVAESVSGASFVLDGAWTAQ